MDGGRSWDPRDRFHRGIQLIDGDVGDCAWPPGYHDLGCSRVPNGHGRAYATCGTLVDPVFSKLFLGSLQHLTGEFAPYWIVYIKIDGLSLRAPRPSRYLTKKEEVQLAAAER